MELARRVGVSQQAMWKIFSGQTKRTRFLSDIARELRTTPEYLTGKSNDPSAEALLPDLTFEQRELLACFDSMDRTDQEMLLAMAMRLAERNAPGRVHARPQSYRHEPAGGPGGR